MSMVTCGQRSTFVHIYVIGYNSKVYLVEYLLNGSTNFVDVTIIQALLMNKMNTQSENIEVRIFINDYSLS